MAQTRPIPSEDAEWSYGKSAPWWDDEIQTAHRELTQAEHSFRRVGTQEAYDLLMGIQSTFQHLRHKKKQDSWRAYCESFDEHTSISELFNAAKRFRNRSSSSDPGMSDETLQLFAKRLAPDSVTQAPTFDQSETGPDEYFGREFTMEELKDVLSSVTDSAPGIDRIRYSMVSCLPHEAKQFLLDCYNEAYRESRAPAWWKIARVIAIKKPGKDARKPESWRPICLLSVLRKVYEKLQLLRLEYWAERNGILADTQYGFRKGRSTMDCLTILLNYIYMAFEKRQVVVASFLDIEGAFDNVDINVLCNKLRGLGVPSNIVRMIWDMMSERSLVFEYQRGGKFQRVGNVGLPQGASDSPFMYNIYTHDLHTVLGEGVEMVEFADDVAMVTMDKNVERAVNRMQRSMDAVRTYFRGLGLELSEKKTIAQIFSRCHVQIYPELTLPSRDGDTRVSIWNREVAATYLGRKLDRKLLMNADMDYTVKRCEQMLNFMRAIAGTW